MAKRKSISKQLRFEVFKRDGFKCQYCGCSAPDVILHVDHIDPVSKGGDNDVMNLITSCQSCNLGKSDRVLSDQTMLEKQRRQLQELNERREQMEMMLRWRESLQEFNDEVVDVLVTTINGLMTSSHVNETGIATIKKWLKKFTLAELLDAAEDSAMKYLKTQGGHGDDVGGFFNYIPRIAAAKRKPESERQILYVRGILRNRLSYVNEAQSLVLMKDAIKAGVSIEEITDLAKTTSSWTAFRTALEGCING